MTKNQIDLPLLPEEPPEPIFEGMLDIETVINKLEIYPPTLPPSIEFLRSIQTWGVRDPIELNQLVNGKYRLMAGRRRLAAADFLKLPIIKIRVYDNLNALQESIFVLDSNTARSKNPLSDFEAIIDLKTKAASKNRILTEKDISILTGLSIGTIRKRMKLAQVPQEILDAVKDKKVALGTAENIAGLSIDDQNTLVDLLNDKSKIIGSDVSKLKKANRETLMSQFPTSIFATPNAEPGLHNHDFKVLSEKGDDREEIQAYCNCGRVIGQSEIMRLLNRS